LTEGNFYFIEDQYFIDFPDPLLMKKKELIAGQPHDRACFFAFTGDSGGIFWMVPFSSNLDKYKTVYHAKLSKYGKCDTIAFGNVLGYQKAFLIQNMCPLINKYVKNEYMDSNFVPVQLDGAFEKKLVQMGKMVLSLERQGKKIIFPDVLAIEKKLLSSGIK
jgi:hypothetical protein